MEDAKTQYQEALAVFRSGNLKEAIAKLEQAIQMDPAFEDALETLGILYAKAERLDDAIDAMKRLSKISPNHIMARTNLSLFYVQKGMILEAEKEQAEARRLSWKAELKAQKSEAGSKNPEAEAKENQKEAENRIARYQKVIELDPKDVLGYFSLGTACADVKRFEEARAAFEQAIGVDSNHSPSYFSLGVILESLGRKDEAREIYRTGIGVADRRGDMIPLKKMEARLKMLGGTK